MASIELRDLSHQYESDKKKGLFGRGRKKEADTCAVSAINICWADGSANALLGPSGCGKTTLLNVISGLIRPTKGQVLFDGKDVTSLTPEQRHVAQVFQFPVVYDSMNVYGNLAFPLRNDGWAEKEVDDRVKEIAATLDLTELLASGVGKLTPADKQKISLGRGLVRPNTAAVLLDEPLTVIDPKQQWDLRRKLRYVQRKLKMTMIYVTHDQHEALTFADHITVMSLGKISQTGTPEELHADPASPFIGYFIGSPGMNIMDCTLRGETFDFGDFSVPVSAGLLARLGSPTGTIQFGIRPEVVEVSPTAREGWVEFSLLTVENTGAYKVLTLERRGRRIKARTAEHSSFAEGTPAWVLFPEEYAKIFKDNVRIDKRPA